MSSSEIDQNLVPEEPATQLYFPPQNERQLTIRAILVGCLVGSIVSCTNIYIGLKIGWAFGASIISAVLPVGSVSALPRTGYGRYRAPHGLGAALNGVYIYRSRRGIGMCRATRAMDRRPGSASLRIAGGFLKKQRRPAFTGRRRVYCTGRVTERRAARRRRSEGFS